MYKEDMVPETPDNLFYLHTLTLKRKDVYIEYKYFKSIEFVSHKISLYETLEDIKKFKKFKKIS